MLTRVEIDGFKTFESFTLDLMPFSVVVGPNAVGKSNLFDALRLLSRMATASDLREAYQGLRGNPTEVFRRVPGQPPASRIRIAVELLVDPDVVDTFGQTHELKTTRMRYAIEVEQRIDDRTGQPRLFVGREEARPIARRDDSWFDRLPKQLMGFKSRRKYASLKPFIETTTESDGRLLIRARQDGVQGRPRPADRLTATYLSTVTNAEDFRHLFAIRQALADLNFLHIDPVAEREPSDFLAPDTLAPNAGNIAAVLHRIRRQTATPDRPDGAVADIALDLANLVTGVEALVVEPDERSRLYELTIQTREGQLLSARLASDGTLRLLALVTLLADPQSRGTLCFEEPENGVHPGRVGPLIELLRDACLPADRPLFQVIVNSHSPAVLKALDGHEHEVIAADSVAIAEPGRALRWRTRMRDGVSRQADLVDPSNSLTAWGLDRTLQRSVERA